MLFYVVLNLALRNSAHGAGVSTSATVDASIGVDLVVRSTLSDGANGARTRASTAADTSVRNNICHDYVHLH